MATLITESVGLVTEHSVARMLGLSVASVRHWRLRKRGPRYLKIGSAVRYKLADVTAWIESLPALGGRSEQ